MNIETTIAMDFGTKTIILPDHNNHKVKLQIWDTAGQERFQSIVKSYLRDVYIAFLVFDMTNIDSWDRLSMWKQELENNKKYNYIPRIVIVGTKSDLPNHKISRDMVKQTANKWNCDYYIISTLKSDSPEIVDNIFSSQASKLHRVIVDRHNTGQELDPSIYKNYRSDVSIYSWDDLDTPAKPKICCFQ
jgi:small GTP-binding protein